MRNKIILYHFFQNLRCVCAGFTFRGIRCTGDENILRLFDFLDFGCNQHM